MPYNQMEDHQITREWLSKLEASKTAAANARPNYWNINPQSLTSPSNIHNLSFGTGQSIYQNSILPAIATAESEVILVTCFWASSATLDALNDTLRKLSTKARTNGGKIRVRICFSSFSILQKLLHTSSLKGTTYPASAWPSKLGLPSVDELEGLDVEVKSIFVLPFCVMHPKFIIIDRKRVFLPSCNVSWEDWFEGSIELSGPIVQQFVRFWKSFWASELDRERDPQTNPFETTQDSSTTPSLFLPSPHHRNPRFRPFPWLSCAPAPPTPLNTFLLTALIHATRKIHIQTPNLTSPPVLTALLAALKRGVDVQILSSERLMLLEQLVTAGTTTKKCLAKLARRHKRLASQQDLESGTRPGRLRICYFRPESSGAGIAGGAEPVQSHLKLTVVDGEWTVLGSGNLDRASWFTSQELGVAFLSAEFARKVVGEVEGLMEGRRWCFYDGGGGSE